MADTVRYIMEDMVPELEDMQRRGYFTRAEIKEVVRRRQEFEYKLKRKAAIKQDYYRCVIEWSVYIYTHSSARLYIAVCEPSRQKKRRAVCRRRRLLLLLLSGRRCC
jgi:U3 small nucleolar RNA-associated protein 6